MSWVDAGSALLRPSGLERSELVLPIACHASVCFGEVAMFRRLVSYPVTGYTIGNFVHVIHSDCKEPNMASITAFTLSWSYETISI